MHPELAWIAEARKYLGLTEIKGSKHDRLSLLGLSVLKLGGETMKLLGVAYSLLTV